MIRLGPAGTSGLGFPEGLEKCKELGLTALEWEFTYGVRIKNDAAKKIGELAKKLGLTMSVHGPYYINLASLEEEKIVASKERILRSCERGHLLGAKYIVFHAGFFQKRDPETIFQIIKAGIKDVQKEVRNNKWDVKLAPEVTGKATQFGGVDELLRLKKETGCHLTVDWAHIKARNQGKIDYDEIFNKLKGIDYIHSHFSGIEWTPKGERKHLITAEKDIREFLTYVKKYKVDITIINESPDPYGDCVKTKKILDKL